MGRYRVGCTGWGYDAWRGPFYAPGTPPSDYLARYARVFDLSEVDSSYYAAPSRAQVARWAEATPPTFSFTMKLPGDVTHKARLRNVDEPLSAFLSAVGPLEEAGKLRALLLQLPASFVRDKDETALASFLDAVPGRFPVAVELRHKSWWTPETYRLLEARGAALVWSVTGEGRAPAVVTADFVYARMIGDRALTRFDRIQRDLRDEMRYWKARFEDEGKSAREVLALVNNHFMGFAPGTAAALHEILGLPPLDLAAAARSAGQRALGEFG